jgi:SNF2 family DNA or RNA helicase
MEIINQCFKPLSEDERDLLCYCAYVSPVIVNDNLNKYRTIVGDKRLSEKRLKEYVYTLKEHMFLYDHRSQQHFFYYETRLNERYAMLALYYLINERRSLLNAFRKAKIKIAPGIERMCNTIELISTGTSHSRKSGNNNKYESLSADSYDALVRYPEMRIFSDALPLCLIPNFICYAVDTAQAQDFENYIPFLEELADKIINVSDKEYVNEVLAFAHYSYDGSYKEIPSPKSHWGYSLKAIHAAYGGDYDIAADLFTKGFTSYNKSHDVKNAYTNSTLAYYSTICFKRAVNRPAHKNRYSLLRSKYGEIGEWQLFPSLLLISYYENDSDLGGSTKHYCERVAMSGYHNSYALCLSIAKYINQSNAVGIREPIHKPFHKMLAHEMRSLFNFSSEELNELNTLYGSTPLLEQEHSMTTWEMTLSKVLELAPITSKSKDKTEDENLPKSRLYYVITPKLNTRIYAQSRLKSGAWGKPREIMPYRFANLPDDSSFDDYDRSMRRAISEYYHSYNTPYYLSALVGCDRVYAEIGSRHVRAVVDKEDAILLLEKNDKGEFLFTSNVNVDKMYNTRTTVVVKSSTHFTVISISETQYNVFRELIHMPPLPPEAEPVLRSFISKIDPKIGIHTSSIEGAGTIKSVQGDPEAVIRIHPYKNLTFTPDILIRPVKGCNELCAPGKGNAVLIDMINGERCQIMRRLTLERDMEKNIRQYIEDLSGTSLRNSQLQAQQMLELMDYVRDLPGYSIEWPKGAELKLKVAKESSWSISMNKAGQWFDVEGEVSIDMNTVLSLAQLLDAVSKSDDKYVKLNDNDYLLISDSIRHQLKRLSEISTTERGKVKISPLQAAVDNEIFGENGLVKVDEEWQDLRTKIIDSYKKTPRVPSALQAELRDYQRDGYLWLKRLTEWGGGACLADDMGLGKTVQAIAYLISEAKSGAALVVAPASVLPNWRNELARFAPSLNVKVLNSSTDRAADISSAKSGDVVLTTYGLLVSEEESLVNKKWHVVCLDEAHTIKNRDTKMSKAAMRLHAAKRLALTGTPIQNHLGELWNLFQFLNPGLLGTHEQFQQKYITPIEGAGDKDVRRQLKRTLAPFMLRRTKKEVADELPDKTEIKISVELTDEETAIYETLRAKAKQQLEKNDKVDVNILSKITQLRRAACTPMLVNKDFVGESSKLNNFLSLVDDICSTGNKVLVFSQFTSFLKLAKDALDKVGVQYLYFDGSTTISQREKIIEQFRDDDNCQLFLISLKAGGLGLNLTEANYVIHLDPWWNPAIEQQATDRAYRIGQKQKVTVYHLIAAHTIEEKILRLHATKRDLADQLLEGTNVSHKLSADDLLDMLSQ